MTHEFQKRPIAPPSQQPGPKPSVSGASNAKNGGAKSKKIANGVVALGSAAIVSLYGLGYVRTQTAEALYNVDAPAIAIATAAPTATDIASAQVTAYQSPLYPTRAATATPTTIAAPASGFPATAAAAPATATTVPATSAAATATKAPAPAMTPTKAASSIYKDGTYTGTGTSPHGSIGASVIVQGGKIVSAEITQCGTRSPCSKIAALPGQVVTRQTATVDLVSGATDSSEAYRGAIQNALAKAKA